MRSATRFKLRVKDVLRQLMPAHVRFVRAGKEFLVSGEREVHELHRLVERGTTVVDVGAHIGDYTYSLCRQVGPQGHVIAVEPQPDLAQLLERATTRLGLPVTVVNCALSADPGESHLLIPLEEGVLQPGFATLESREGDAKSCRVAVRRLDDICKDAPGRISFIKIDVEGHELQVLRGAVETLKRHRPNLLVEIEQRHSPVPIAETFAFIRSQGYRGEFLDAEGKPAPLETFTPAIHQTRRGDDPRSRQAGYVSNFIFRAAVPDERGAQPVPATSCNTSLF